MRPEDIKYLLCAEGQPTLRATQPCALNDPFESVPSVRDIPRQSPFPSPDLIPKLGPEVYRQIRDSHAYQSEWHGHKAAHATFEETASKIWGVTSFSVSPFKTLMWSHYASTTGMVIGIGTRALLDIAQRTGGKLGAINYRRERPQLLNAAASDEGLLLDGLFTKCIDWAYEDEWRLVTPLQATRVSGTDDNVLLVHLVDIGREAVKEIYVVERHHGSLAHVQAALDNTAYAVDKIRWQGKLDCNRIRCLARSRTTYDYEIYQYQLVPPSSDKHDLSAEDDGAGSDQT